MCPTQPLSPCAAGDTVCEQAALTAAGASAAAGAGTTAGTGTASNGGYGK